MPHHSSVVFQKQKFKICACDVICHGLYRGSRWNEDEHRMFPLNRWLCEQCVQNIRDEDDGNKIRLIKKQVVTPEQEAAWEIWYEENRT